MATEMEIEHFLHDHPLSLIQDQEDYERFRCSGCEKGLSSPSYGCSYCGFFLHKSCSQIQRHLQHYFHPCPLELTTRGYICNACFDDHSGFGFCCQKCEFDLDLECALTLTTIKTEDDGQIQHFTHRHPLQLVDLNKEQDEVFCSICEKLCSDVVYGCKKCNFFLHYSCMDIPRVINQHQFHPEHSLVLLTTPSYDCRGCEKACSGLAYRCGQCYFEFDVKCALLPTADCEGAEWIQHFTHHHPLQLIDPNKEEDEVHCSICRKLCSDFIYGCKKCNFFLHHSCMDLPREINQHPFHPNHSLVLFTNSSYKCKGCDKDCSGLAYSCGQCSFLLDVKCAFLPTADCEVAEWIQRFSHQHSLQLVDLNKEEDEVRCSISRKLCLDFIYGCKKCNFFLHHSCMDIPREINQHPFHPNHSLVLFTKSSYKCKGCDKDCSGLAYKCQACLFELDVECVLLPTANCEGAKWIQHVYHHHPLELCEIEDGREARCWACRENSPGPYFVCDRCNFFLHQSCAIDLLPQTIQDHPFHPTHCLKIKSYNKSEEQFFCRACGKDDSNVLGYCCVDCSDFQFHLDCSKLKPSIKYRNHRHLFTLFQKLGDPGTCFICKDYCMSFFLRCVSCDITLHLQCHPLARKTLKHEAHGHPLTLTKSPLDSDLKYYGDRSEYHCDFCELPRPATDPVYYCKECDLSADIQCFISQVLHSVAVEDHSGVGEDKDDNFREGKSCSTTDPKVVKFDEEIEELASQLEHKELRRKELKAQVKGLQSEIEELSIASDELKWRIERLERYRLSYFAYRTSRLQL